MKVKRAEDILKHRIKIIEKHWPIVNGPTMTVERVTALQRERDAYYKLLDAAYDCILKLEQREAKQRDYAYNQGYQDARKYYPEKD